MDNNSLILEKIEQYRDEMIILSNDHGLTSEIVIESSKKLDDLLNTYQY
ncbi:aspartyl-phosphate phosphatase Spo0E family protein [Virgibacillus siamensis]|nr:aspartyl-phosphate phosphatase Spo0E family protein [Virgibacillus siamensis]